MFFKSRKSSTTTNKEKPAVVEERADPKIQLAMGKDSAIEDELDDEGAGTIMISHPDSKRAANKEEQQYWWHCPPPFADEEMVDLIDDLEINNEIQKKLDNNSISLLDIPQNIVRIVQIVNDPDFSYNEVGKLVSQSPVLMAEFLKLANSVAFSRGVRLNDIRVVLPRLGVTVVKSVLYLNSAKMTLANQPAFRDIATDIVNHCRAVAVICKYLSQRYYPDPDNAFMAGLLHDIGKLTILKELTSKSSGVAISSSELSEDSLRNIFSIFHEKIGGRMAQDWDLHPEIGCSIAHHHDFTAVQDPGENELGVHLSALVNVADAMARILGVGRSISGVDIFALPAAEMIGMHKDDETIEFLQHIPGIVKKN